MDTDDPPRPDALGASGAGGASIGDDGRTLRARTDPAPDLAAGERVAMIADAAGIGLWAREIDTGALFWSASNRALYGLAPGQPVTVTPREG